MQQTHNEEKTCTGSTSSSSTSVSSSCGNGCLDGVAIGSDHNCDMVLCFGNFKDQEEDGCGAISEIVVFKGCCHACVMHRMLHNVTKWKNDNKQEEECKRLGHELMTSQPNYVDDNCSIALSVSSNHKVLSWCRHSSCQNVACSHHRTLQLLITWVFTQSFKWTSQCRHLFVFAVCFAIRWKQIR